MMPEPIPNICNDKGVQQEVRDAVRARLKRTSFHGDSFTAELEEALYHAMMDGMRSGFSYGWRICEQRMKKQGA